MARRTPFSGGTIALLPHLRNAGVASEAEVLFELWPALRSMALNFFWYVTPLVAWRNGEFEAALRNAVRGFAAQEKNDLVAAHKSYIVALLGIVKPLCALRLSVRAPDDSWPIWDYDQPLGDWMKRYCASALQTRERDEPVDSLVPTIKLLAYVCTARDMQQAGLTWSDVVAQ